MTIAELLASATDGMTVRRVFGDPVETPDGLVIPVARVSGGAGGGLGDDGHGSGGSGGGTGFHAVPVGVYRVSGERVTWHPVVNANAVLLGAQVLVGAAILVLGLRRRR